MIIILWWQRRLQKMLATNLRLLGPSFIHPLRFRCSEIRSSDQKSQWYNLKRLNRRKIHIRTGFKWFSLRAVGTECSQDQKEEKPALVWVESYNMLEVCLVVGEMVITHLQLNNLKPTARQHVVGRNDQRHHIRGLRSCQQLHVNFNRLQKGVQCGSKV